MSTKTRSKRGTKNGTKSRTKAYRPQHMADNNAIYRVMSKVQLFVPAEVVRLSTPVWLEWELLKTGKGTNRSVLLLAEVFGASLVIAETVQGDPDELCISMIKRGQEALQILRDRHDRLGTWGVCYQTLEHIPPVIEFHDELLKTCTPVQLENALKEAYRRAREEDILEALPC
jgi:hypothetical protein